MSMDIDCLFSTSQNVNTTCLPSLAIHGGPLTKAEAGCTWDNSAPSKIVLGHVSRGHITWVSLPSSQFWQSKLFILTFGWKTLISLEGYIDKTYTNFKTSMVFSVRLFIVIFNGWIMKSVGRFEGSTRHLEELRQNVLALVWTPCYLV